MAENNLKQRPTRDYDDRMLKLDTYLNIDKNKELVRKFMQDCLLGKTVKNKGKKTIGKGRLSSYLSFLKLMDHYFNKPFDEIILADLEDFIRKLQTDEIKNRYGKPYTEESKMDIKKTIKKFMKWLYSDKKEKYEELTNWLEVYRIKSDISALSKDSIDKIISYAPNLRLKVFFQTLFDSGARINEYLNIRWCDFTYVEKIQCYKVRLRDEAAKTFGRTITLPLSTALIKEWERANPLRKQEDFFMPLTHRNAHALCFRWSKKVMGKGMGCHVFGRHSSATYYAGKLMPYVFTKRFGWTMGSTMAARYIDREGIEMEEATEDMQQDVINEYKEKMAAMDNDLKFQKMQMQEEAEKKTKELADLKNQMVKEKEEMLAKMQEMFITMSEKFDSQKKYRKVTEEQIKEIFPNRGN